MARNTSVARCWRGLDNATSGSSTSSRATRSKTLTSNATTAPCVTPGSHTLCSTASSRCRTRQHGGYDLQPRAPEHGARWHHPQAEVGLGRIAPLLATTKNGGITEPRGVAATRTQIEIERL